MNTRFSWIFAFALIPTLAVADAYVCQNGSKKIIQTEPCSSQHQTTKALQTAPSISQEESAASATKELVRQQQWMYRRYRQQAAELAAQQEIQRQAEARQAAYLQQQRLQATQQQAAQEVRRQRYLESVEASEIENDEPITPHPARRPTTITDQSNGFMRDNAGNNYLKNGDFLYGRDGTRCMRNGSVYNCN